MPKESDITAKINKMISEKCIAWKINTTTRRGMPDCQYIGPGNNLWVEYKRIIGTRKILHVYKRLTAIQSATIKKLIKLNEEVWVIVILNDDILILKDLEWEKPITVKPGNIYTPQEVVNEIHEFIGVKCTS
jgi:hypothetical protein